MGDLVEVTQADRQKSRELRSEIVRQLGPRSNLETIEDGDFDVQLFALHRLSAIPLGYKLVPIKPTEAMCDAGNDVDQPNGETTWFTWKVWSAMLNAAPEIGG